MVTGSPDSVAAGGSTLHISSTTSVPYDENAENEVLKRIIVEASCTRSSDFATPAQEWEDHVRLHALVGELTRLQRAKPHCGSEHAHIQKGDFRQFRNWLKYHGVCDGSIDFKNFGEMGNGLVAVKNLRIHEVVVQIPKKLMMTTETGLRCPDIADLASDPVLQIVPSCFLALHLLRESLEQQSFWAPYIALLPRLFNIPLWYSLNELETLKGSHVMREAIRLYRNVVRQYWHVRRLLKQQARPAIPLSSFTYEAFRWAVSVVMTRQNALPLRLGSSEEHLALVPVWDMCNHEELRNNTTAFDPKSGTLEFLAARDFSAGEQVTNFYGNRPNAQLLLYSGFVDPAAYPRDVVQVPVGMSGGRAAERRKRLCTAYGIPSSSYFELRYPPLVGRSRRLLLAVLAAVLPEADLSEAARIAKSSGEFDPLRGWGTGPPEALERAALEWLKVRCQIVLRRYAISSEEDELLLQSQSSEEPSSSTYRRRCAALLRVGERKLLTAVIDHINNRLSA